MVPVTFQLRVCISDSWDASLKINDKIMECGWFYFLLQNVAFVSLYGTFFPAPDNYQKWICV